MFGGRPTKTYSGGNFLSTWRRPAEGARECFLVIFGSRKRGTRAPGGSARGSIFQFFVYVTRCVFHVILAAVLLCCGPAPCGFFQVRSGCWAAVVPKFKAQMVYVVFFKT